MAQLEGFAQQHSACLSGALHTAIPVLDTRH